MQRIINYNHTDMIDEMDFYNSSKATFMINRYLFSLWSKIQFVRTLELKQKTSFEIPGLYRC